MEKRKDLREKLKALYESNKKKGLKDTDWNKLILATSHHLAWRRKLVMYSVFAGFIALVIGAMFGTMDPRCIVGNNLILLELARPAVTCDVCRSLESVPTVDGDTFTKEQFLQNYAYNGIPLLVKGGARNWTALNTFSFPYLKDLFENTDGALEAVEHDCQFFPYKTDFLNMAEVFNMSEARSRLEPGEKQWYVGW